MQLSITQHCLFFSLFLCPLAFSGNDVWPYPDSLDAVNAAPDSHEILLENDKVRVLRVVIEPGSKEPFHTHRSGSVMIVDKPAQINYYGEEGDLLFFTKPTDGKHHQMPQWLDPEVLHSVENIDDKVYKAYRIEIKE
ncbi:hypothetical protein [Endozoicomonas elysicola]|uniref:hypothetical protein n=1 Tax=Endozoicomonas elysicola TaxID=305900 RepID=UPI000380A141|nr:hypothetical protein [Endozoicomonas elysicola]